MERACRSCSRRCRGRGLPGLREGAQLGKRSRSATVLNHAKAPVRVSTPGYTRRPATPLRRAVRDRSGVCAQRGDRAATRRRRRSGHGAQTSPSSSTQTAVTARRRSASRETREAALPSAAPAACAGPRAPRRAVRPSDARPDVSLRLGGSLSAKDTAIGSARCRSLSSTHVSRATACRRAACPRGVGVRPARGRHSCSHARRSCLQ